LARASTPGKWPDIFFIPPRGKTSAPQLTAPAPATPLAGFPSAPVREKASPELHNVLLPTQIPMMATDLLVAPTPAQLAAVSPMPMPTALPKAVDAPREVMVSEPGMLFSGAADASPSQPLRAPAAAPLPTGPAAALLGLTKAEVPKITLPARMEDEPAFQPSLAKAVTASSITESNAVIPGVSEEEGGGSVVPGLPEDDDVVPGIIDEDVIPRVAEDEQDGHPLLESEAVIPGVVISQSQEVVTPVKSGAISSGSDLSRSSASGTTVSVSPAPSAGSLVNNGSSTLADVSPDSLKEFLLTNGERVRGKVLHEKEDWIYLQNAVLGVVTIPRDMIAKRPMEVILINGDRVSGEIIAETKEHIYLRNDALGMLTIPRRSAPRKVVEAITRDGDRIVGELLSETKEQLVIRSAALGTITIRFDGLQKLNTKAEQAALTAG
jgi:RNase P/RNase MRP subunit p29